MRIAILGKAVARREGRFERRIHGRVEEPELRQELFEARPEEGEAFW